MNGVVVVKKKIIMINTIIIKCEKKSVLQLFVKMSILLVIFFELGLERAAELGLERAAAELWFDDDVLLFVLTMV